MKTNPTAFLLTLAAVLTGHCLALTPITENFKAPKLDKARWYQMKTGKARFVQSQGRLNFLVTGKPTKSDYVTLELVESRPGMFEDWEMILDLTNTAKQGKKTQAGCGFLISSSENPLDYLFVDFFGAGGIDAAAYNNGTYVSAKPLSLHSGVPKGAVRVSFDKKSKLMTFSASLKTKKQGYEWIKVGTFAPVGAKNADVKADWDISTTDGLLGIKLFGFAISQNVPTGQINIDNFSLKAP